MLTNWKTYLPLVALAVGAGWLILRLSKSGTNNQVVNRVIPVQDATDETALAQIQAQFQLGKLQLEAGSALAEKQVDAERQRLEFANRALEIQGNFGLEGLKIEAAKVANQSQLQSELSKIALDASLYDTQLRANAASELLRQQRNSSILNTLAKGGSDLLAQLLKAQQSQSRPSSGSGSGASIGSPPFNPNATRSTRASNQDLITRFIQRYLSNPDSPIGYQDYDSLGYVPYLDLQPFYDAEVNAYDNWLDCQQIGTRDAYSDYPSFINPSEADYFYGDPGSQEAYDFFGFDFE